MTMPYSDTISRFVLSRSYLVVRLSSLISEQIWIKIGVKIENYISAYLIGCLASTKLFHFDVKDKICIIHAKLEI